MEISQKTIQNYLHDFHYTLKRISIQPQARNTAETIEKRRIYADQFMQMASRFDEKLFIFLDEVGFSASMRAGRGRSIRGSPAVKIVTSVRTRNIFVCCAINKNGIIHYSYQTSAFNTITFVDYLSSLFEKLNEKNLQNAIFILDNVTFHKVTQVREIIAQKGHQLLFLPPYSPFINPIENMFSKWKEAIRRNNPQNEPQLFELIENGATLITADDCASYYRHMLGYIPRCIRGEIIEN